LTKRCRNGQNDNFVRRIIRKFVENKSNNFTMVYFGNKTALLHNKNFTNNKNFNFTKNGI